MAERKYDVKVEVTMTKGEYAALKRLADKDLRTPEAQATFIVRNMPNLQRRMDETEKRIAMHEEWERSRYYTVETLNRRINDLECALLAAQQGQIYETLSPEEQASLLGEVMAMREAAAAQERERWQAVDDEYLGRTRG